MAVGAGNPGSHVIRGFIIESLFQDAGVVLMVSSAKLGDRAPQDLARFDRVLDARCTDLHRVMMQRRGHVRKPNGE